MVSPTGGSRGRQSTASLHHRQQSGALRAKTKTTADEQADKGRITLENSSITRKKRTDTLIRGSAKLFGRAAEEFCRAVEGLFKAAEELFRAAKEFFQAAMEYRQAVEGFCQAAVEFLQAEKEHRRAVLACFRGGRAASQSPPLALNRLRQSPSVRGEGVVCLEAEKLADPADKRAFGIVGACSRLRLHRRGHLLLEPIGSDPGEFGWGLPRFTNDARARRVEVCNELKRLVISEQECVAIEVDPRRSTHPIARAEAYGDGESAIATGKAIGAPLPGFGTSVQCENELLLAFASALFDFEYGSMNVHG